MGSAIKNQNYSSKNGLNDKAKNIGIRFINKYEAFLSKLQGPYFELLKSYPEIDYSKLTVVIPYRKSPNPDREQNLDITLKYLKEIGITNVIISEHSTVSNRDSLVNEYKDLFKSFKVIHTPSPEGEAFNLSKALNRGIIRADTPYVATSDLDCITKKKNVDTCLALLERGYDVVHPFNRRITDIVDKEKFKEGYDFNLVKSPEQRRRTADGGIVFWNKQSLVFIGMLNEYFLGWGGEDNEVMHRAKICGLKHYRIDDTLYHLYHHRSGKRSQTNVEQEEKTRQIKTKEECLKQVDKWPWVKDAKKKF